jgi:HAD superfamily hydrolase (TIGR01549 family)
VISQEKVDSMIRILFTGVGRRIELLQAFRSAALVLNKDLIIYGADMSGTAPALVYCDYVRRVVAMKDPAYINNLLEICQEDSIDLIIPTIDTDLLLLSENREKFKNVGTKVMISDINKIQICRDKNYTSQFFIDCGLHAPIPVNNWKEYKSGFPAFIKPKDGSGSINAFRADNVEELEMYAGQIDEYIVQPFVDGREYTIDIFCDWYGNPITITPRERLQVRAGEVLQTQICMDQLMIDESRAICKEFKPCGPLTVQLIRDNANVDWFIEINPRFGGGSPLSMKAGARSAEAVLKLIDHESTGEYIVADNSIYSRFDQSVCIKEGEGTIKGVIFDLDDTLYNEKEYIRSGFKAVSDYLGGGYENRLWQFFEADKPAIDELLVELGQESKKQTILDIYRSHKPDIHLHKDVKKMLKQLRKKGYKIGIITDGRPEGQKNKIDALELEDLIDDVIVTDELGGVQFRKPCDLAFRLLVKRWKIYFADVVYVGDNPKKDFQAPHQLGMKTIYYNNPNGLYGKTDSILNNMYEAKSIVEIEKYICE